MFKSYIHIQISLLKFHFWEKTSWNQVNIVHTEWSQSCYTHKILNDLTTNNTTDTNNIIDSARSLFNSQYIQLIINAQSSSHASVCINICKDSYLRKHISSCYPEWSVCQCEYYSVTSQCCGVCWRHIPAVLNNFTGRRLAVEAKVSLKSPYLPKLISPVPFEILVVWDVVPSCSK